MRIRAATEADADPILRLWRDGTSVVSHTDDVDGVRTLLARDPEALLVAEDEEGKRLMGTLIAAWDGWRAGFYRLVVAPEDRRRGVASALVRRAEEHLRDLGARKVGVVVILDHEHARDFWVEMGYLHEPQTGRFVKLLDAG
jgi:ribosomal protein S18 acetylase RimI-like enzyme